MEQSHVVEHSKEIERSSEKECISGKDDNSGKQCCSVLKSNDGKNSRVQFKATRHVKKQKSVVDFFLIRSTHNFDFWVKSQVYVFQ